MPIIDLSNQRFGRLVVLSRASEPGETVKWLCQCDCGKQKIIRGDSLRNGRTTSCGCFRAELMSKKNTKNLTNQVFGRLTVLEKSQKKASNSRNVIWKCKCECGNIIDVPGGALTSGNTTSCGCKRKETIHEVLGAKLIGQRFGKLVVIEELGSKNNNIQWLCKCDCGNSHISTSTLLLSNRVQSCGCLNSTGELKIIQLLTENNIFYEYQKRFINCKFPNTLQYAVFDFYVNNEYIIEFDGKQHFGLGDYWGQNAETEFQNLAFRDSYKNNWCKDNNIPIIRIPYTRLKELTIDDLKLETSKFII